MLRWLGVTALVLAGAPGLAFPECDRAGTMAALGAAIRADDVTGLVELFPSEAPVLLTTTIEDPPLSDWVPAARLAADLAARQGHYALIVTDAEGDAFADVFHATGFLPWRMRGAGRFLPPGAQYDDGRTYVRIACTPEGAVIVELAWPAA